MNTFLGNNAVALLVLSIVSASSAASDDSLGTLGIQADGPAITLEDLGFYKIALKKKYIVRNVDPRKKHVNEGGNFDLELDVSNKTWTGAGAGIQSAGGSIICGGVDCAVMKLRGNAVVDVPDDADCTHDITITGTPSGNIFMVFRGGNACGKHGDRTFHPGEAHGTSQ